MTRYEDTSGVVINLAVMSGAPCIRGTRIPVATVLGMLAEYDCDPVPILADFPQLSRADLRSALAYAAQALTRPDRDPPESAPAVGVNT